MDEPRTEGLEEAEKAVSGSGKPRRKEPEGARRARLGFLFAFLGALCWGFSGTCVSYLTHNTDASVTWLAWARLAICGIAFLLVALVRQKPELKETLTSGRELIRMVFVALIGVVLMQLSYMSSIAYLGTGPALLVMESGLIIIMLVTCVRSKRLPYRREFLGLVLTIAGIAAIGTQGHLGSLGVSGIGLLWGIGSAIALAGHNMIPFPLLQKYGSVIVNAVSMTMAAIMLLPFARPWEVSVHLGSGGIAAFAAVIVVGTFAAYCLYMQGIKYLGPMKASLIATMEPVSGMFFSLIWLGTPITLWDAIGGVLIIGMMVIIARPSEKQA